MSGARTSWRAVSFAYKAFTHSEGRVSENCLKNAYTMHAYRLQRARVPKSLEALSIKTYDGDLVYNALRAPPHIRCSYHVMTLSSSSSSHPPHAAAGTVALPLALPSGCSDRDSVSSYECRASPNNNGGGNTAAADASAMTPASFQAPDVASPLFFSNDNGGSSERNTGRDSAVGTPLAVATPYPLTFVSTDHEYGAGTKLLTSPRRHCTADVAALTGQQTLPPESPSGCSCADATADESWWWA